MTEVTLDRDQAAHHAKVLMEGRAAWFYGYHFTPEEYHEYENALLFFDGVREQLKEKAQEAQS